MGFSIARAFTLDLSGTVLAGATVRMTAPAIETFMSLFADEIDVQQQMGIFADHVVDWDFDDREGEPLPIGVAGLQQLDRGQFSLLISRWGQAVREVDAPLEKRSSDGAPSLVASMSMETL